MKFCVARFARVKWLILALIYLGCSPASEQRNTFKIGFSQCTSYDNWRQSMQEEMYRELSFHDDLELKIKDAGGESSVQIKQIREFLDANVDLLIVSPHEADPITPIVQEAFQRGVPVVLLDRKTNSNFYTSFIGADNFNIGQIAGRYAANCLDGKGAIIEVKGIQSSTPFIDRHQGFQDMISGYPDIKVSGVEGDWGVTRDGEAAFKKLFENGVKYDMVYAHSDFLGFAVYNVLKEMGLENEIEIIGIDGLAGPNGGIQYVYDDILKATILYPTGGDKAIQVASDILHNRPYDKENELTTTVIDSSNVRVMKMQTNKILGHQRDINRMVEKINQQKVVYKSQQYFLYILAFLFVLSALSFAYTLKLLRERRETNKSLNRRNEEILRQRNEVVEMSEKANEAIQAKIDFFSNVSHEFKTPLTLILGHLDELQESNGNKVGKDAGLIRQNAMRLSRLVSQLMDFQKLENNRMILKAGRYDLVAFTTDVVKAFKPLARRGSYQFDFYPSEPELWVWFDRSMLDKVLFNLLSNAFKFTPERGRIKVFLEVESSKNQVHVIVEDNGAGMNADELSRAFERYYRGDETRVDGTGLGLPLSKELIDLHHGNISVTSEKGTGTRFTVSLLLGDEHLTDKEKVSEGQLIDIHEIDYNFQNPDSEPLANPKITLDQTVLIIEDDKDLRQFLSGKLQKHFNVLEAENGEAGIAIAVDQVPDLILCDIKMPKVKGTEVLKKMKSDHRTSHIAFVVMTSDDSLEEKMVAIKQGADDFISKPFNFSLLLERIKTILTNRLKLRDHYVHELPVEQSTKTAPNLDKKFVNDFVSLVEEHIGNPRFDVNEICDQMGMSRIQLYRKVKSMLGYSVADYVTSVRLKKAKFLLVTTDQPVAEIGYAVGFSSPSYFSATFKGRFGLTPKEFQKANQKV
ncbi:substrate-binding domain-containing protein [Marinoscillum sp. MHG1-6]|uniref:hybrid sensor histidine kinase/response regulator transcription factor n=1 Tax=Marinoscillum sp. MHG1-6 TaxID=2959627 RepID=UPI0021586C2E|nr:substrate-binding domain-containing protein [Marinoscillum sp. MHG1-6]